MVYIVNNLFLPPMHLVSSCLPLFLLMLTGSLPLAQGASPIFTNIQSGTVLTVGENAQANTQIFTVTATDNDGGPLTFSLTPISAGNPFSIGSTSGVITVTSQNDLDYETTKSYSVIIRVTDNTANSSQVTITINVEDVNDNAPVIATRNINVVMKEETAPGTVVPFDFSVSDPDTGTVLTYTLIGAQASMFNIDQSTNIITLNTKVNTDANENMVYNPILIVSDGAHTATATLTLTLQDINDHAPVCSPNVVYKSHPEETIGTLYTLTCTDGDSSYSNNNILTYTLVDGDASKFTVDSSRGVITAAAVDYEVTREATLKIKVEDNAASGKLSTTATILVLIMPVNDNIPTWGTWSPAVPSSGVYTVGENIGVGMTVFTMVANDADMDVGGTITYSTLSITDGTNPVRGVFNLDPTTGQLTTLRGLDTDGGIVQYIFHVQATDGGNGSHTMTMLVYLELADVNDNAPAFQGTPFVVRVIPETMAKAGSLVITVSANDRDVTPTTFTYSVGAVIQGTTQVNDWTFSAALLGRLEFAAAIDLDRGSGMGAVSVLRLLVTDGGSPALTGTATLTVSISPDNEFAPTIRSQPGTTVVSVAENVPVGMSVTQVNGDDEDVGAEGILAYSITAGNSGGVFGIDASGNIFTNALLDRELASNYLLSIKIQDSGAMPIKSVTTTVTVSVADVNDNMPKCMPLFQVVAVLETTVPNTVVAIISCTDADLNDTLSYSVRSPHDSIFDFNNPVDHLRLISGLDYDSAAQTYDLDMDVSDGIHSQTVKIHVRVDAVNEHIPIFALNSTVTVKENVISNAIVTYTGTDTDYAPHNIVSYAIQSVTNGGFSFFGIDSSSGEISLSSALNYESLPAADKTYKLEVVAADGGGLLGTGTVTVVVADVNDNGPVCSQSTFAVNMDEKQVGTGPYTVIASLGCTDAENGTALIYALLSQTPGTHFTVERDAILLTADTLDYETSTSHTLTVKITDSGSPVRSTTLSVYVYVKNLNEGAPTFPPVTPLFIDENIGIGQSVADVVAIDPDGSDPVYGDLQYSIVSGDPAGKFSINVNTGHISTRRALDYETTHTYSLVIQAKERGGGNTATVTQVINLNDINDEYPVCSPNTLAETVAETEVVDFVVADFACTDKDAISSLTYTITSGDTNLFKMVGSQLRLKIQLDFEVEDSYDLTITISDSIPSHNVVIRGTVNVGSVDEGPPVFITNPYLVSVNEAQAVASVIQIVSAADPDSVLDGNGQVKYSFTASYPQFTIDQNSGQILVAQKLDRETVASHTLIVKASDAKGSTTATVSVTVLDSNDNAPQFSSNSYSGTMSESEPAGTSILSVAATDRDDPGTNSYGKVTYILSGSNKFAIDPTTGVITNTVVLDADTGNNFYPLTVTAVDSKGLAGAHTASVLVTISVTTVNQHDPLFNPVTISVIIDENQFSVGNIIATVTVSDTDTGVDGETVLSFVNPQTKFSLMQNGNVGSIYLLQNLDFDSGDKTFAIEIKVTDKGTPPRSSTGSLLVTVNDVNDNSPLCISVISVDKTEGQKDIATLSCSDPDPGSVLTYTIISVIPNTISPIVSGSGVVSVATALDYETGSAYTIIIKVEDNGVSVMKSTSVTINLQITDLNDNDPTMSGSFAFTLSESDSASNTVLYTVVANSNDGPADIITYSLSNTTYFDISASTGKIILKMAAPDYETVGATYLVDVCAKDSPNPTVRSVCNTISVTITDVNDEAPVFSPTVYLTSVVENEKIGTTVTPVTAADADGSARFNTITYSIFTGDPGGHWSITNTGALVTRAVLDYETKPDYTLVITASDGFHTTKVNYNIQVIPVNEYDPIFTPSSETTTISENVSLGTSLSIVPLAKDGDSGPDGTLRYSIDSGPFSINPVTGIITVTSNLDRETTPSYTLIVQAVDRGTKSKTGTLLLTVTIIDVNDNTPSCTSSVYSATVPETVPSGTTVATIVCTDDDDDPANLNNALKYTITSGPTIIFTVDSFGVITNIASFDHEVTPFYQLIIEVTDQSPITKLTFSATVSVTILDVNDNAPVFTTLPSSRIPEDTALGTIVTTVVANDSDSGINKQLEYEISKGNTGAKFYIDKGTGQIILQTTLDFETPPHVYSLEIIVTDKGNPFMSAIGTATITITDVNDHAPVCATSLYTVTVPENSQNTPVIQVNCTDSDSAGSVAYSITGGNTYSDFTIDSVTGALRTSSSANINYENTQFYTLTVTASDGVQFVETTVKVTISDVNEFKPQFSSAGPYSVTISENVALSYTVTTVTASDLDTYDTVKLYSITAGNTAKKFMIDSVTGCIKVQDYLDYENTTSYALNLTVMDSGGLTSTVILDIIVTDVNDNSPVCIETYVAVSVDEGISSGSIYNPTCSDLDKVASPVLEYTITSGMHASISINTVTGELSLVGGLDYETLTTHDLIIQVSDMTKTVVINVRISVNPINEHTPAFSPSASYGTFSVPENTAAGTSIAQVTATDVDKGLKHGTIYYTIVGGDPQLQFGVDMTTGAITLVKALDRETTFSYSLTVRAADDDPGVPTQRTADAKVKIDITDVNDNTPVFIPSLYTVNVVETAPYGPAVVLKVLTVKDEDAGNNSNMTITIISGNNDGKFSITGSTLILSGQLDYENTTYYELILQVSDSGSPPLKSTCRAIVNVLPANEKAPLMTTANSLEIIPEDTPVGTLVFDVNATDSDHSVDGQITYSISSGVTNNEFVINPSTGQLYVGSQLEYDMLPNTYSIIIIATDGAGLSDAKTSTVSLSIVLQDVNDHFPQFPSVFIFSANENVALGTAVGTVVATDKDTGVNGILTYTELGGSGSNYFNIDSSRGVVTTTGAIDYEQFQVFYLTVTAHDSGSPSHTSTGLVKIQINNMNDNNPVIIPEDFTVIVSESTVVGSTIYTFTVSDPDTTAINILRLVPVNSFFQVDSTAGVITTQALLDREKQSIYILLIEAIDQATSSDPAIRTFTATLTIIIEDINDNDPVIMGTYTPTVLENSALNTFVCQINATDADANENGQLTYSIIGGNTGNAFKIDSTGNIQVAQPQDRESLASYTLIVLVSDKGIPVRSDQVDVTVTIADFNDNDPVFTSRTYTFIVAENSNVGTVVAAVTATDADTGVNGALTYSIDSLLVGPGSAFSITGATGVITVASAGIDREMDAMYKVRIKVTDAGTPFSRFAFSEVIINVDDLNDNAPVFGNAAYNGSVDENSPTTTPILQVVATDVDTGINAAVTYSIHATLLDGPTANTYLKIEVTTGIIFPKTVIDYEANESFQFIVVATDGGTPVLTGTATVTVRVSDVNDNRPIFRQTFYNAEVAYAGQCQSTITTVSASDIDSGNSGLISYSLLTTAYDYLFTVDPSTGELRLRSVTTAYNTYVLDIQANDAGTPILTAAVTVKARVDAYIPNNHVVTFRLKISRSSFLHRQATFIANLQAMVRNVYPNGLVRLWCIEEYNGLAQQPATGRRKLLAEKPVNVHMYVIRDDSTESITKLSSDKEYLSQDQFFSIVSLNPEGDPGSSIQGPAWDYFEIERVQQYFEETKTWWDQPYGIAITFFAILLGLVFVSLLTFFVVRWFCGRACIRQRKNQILNVTSSKTSPAQEKISTWDIDNDVDGQPYRRAFPPILITNPGTFSTVTNNLNSYQTPRIRVFSNANVNLDYNIERQFDGTTYDHTARKMYQYSTKRNEPWLP